MTQGGRVVRKGEVEVKTGRQREAKRTCSE